MQLYNFLKSSLSSTMSVTIIRNWSALSTESSEPFRDHKGHYRN